MGRYLGSKVRKTWRYSRETDQILHEDMKSADSVTALQNQEYDEEKPGLAQFYCVPCARYCESEHALKTHEKAKVHKRRLRDLKFGPYTTEEADFAAGKDVAKFMKKAELQRQLKSNDKVDSILNPVSEQKELKGISSMDIDLGDESVAAPEQVETAEDTPKEHIASKEAHELPIEV